MSCCCFPGQHVKVVGLLGWVAVHICAPDLIGVLEGHSHTPVASMEGSWREEVPARWRDARLLASVNVFPVDAPPVKQMTV